MAYWRGDTSNNPAAFISRYWFVRWLESRFHQGVCFFHDDRLTNPCLYQSLFLKAEDIKIVHQPMVIFPPKLWTRLVFILRRSQRTGVSFYIFPSMLAVTGFRVPIGRYSTWWFVDSSFWAPCRSFSLWLYVHTVYIRSLGVNEVLRLCGPMWVSVLHLTNTTIIAKNVLEVTNLFSSIMAAS